MALGQFNKVVVFKKNTATTLGAGKLDSYATYCTTRGMLRKQSGSRGLTFGEFGQNNSFELTVRHETLLENNLRMDNKIEIGSKVYSIQSWEKIDEKNFYYRFIINEFIP